MACVLRDDEHAEAGGEGGDEVARLSGFDFQFCQRPAIGPTHMAASRLKADFVRTSSCRRSAKFGYPGVWQ